MGSNYKAIGNYIQLVDERNKGLKVTTLLGLSISKQFIKSVANTIGTDMENYKIIRKNQFACSTMQVRRDRKMPVALFIEVVPAIISQAYPIFEIIDITILLPEYLMMWFTRSEFDREACFHAVGGVRGSLEWEDFCGMKLPIPSLEKQVEIVKEYNTIQNRISLNNQLITKLEETAQAIYKQWFVDFEFPDANGKPYKSNDGEMVFCEELDKEIPVGWEYGNLGNLSTQFAGFSFKGEEYSFDEGITVVRGENVTEKKLRWDTHKKWSYQLDARMRKCFLEEHDIVVGMDGSKVGKNWALISKHELPLLLAQRVTSIRSKNKVEAIYILLSMMVLKFEDYVEQIQTGTSVPHISGQQITDFPILIPTNKVLTSFDERSKILIDKINLNIELSKKLEELKDLLLARMTKVESEIETVEK
jgi:type I restriction enzyme S subunit